MQAILFDNAVVLDEKKDLISFLSLYVDYRGNNGDSNALMQCVL